VRWPRPALPAGLAIATLLAVVDASAPAAFELPPVTRVTLENGLRLIVVEVREVPLVELYVMVGAGAAQDPPGKEGLASLTADALTRGAGALSAEDFARAVDSLGGSLGASAGIDATIVNGEFLSDDFAAGLELLRLVLREPTFAGDEIRRARDAQVAALVAALENPATVAEKCFAAFLYGDYPYGRWVDGTKAGVMNIGRGNVRGFHRRWFRPNNTIMAIAGDVDAADAVARVREAFGSWEPRADALPERAPPPVPLTRPRVLLVDEPDASQAQIRIGAIARARNDPALLTAQVANTVLGGGFSSKLVDELRVKRSLTYGASSAFVARLTGGDFRISTFSKSPTAVETAALALEVEAAFRRDPIDPQALDKAKSYLQGQFPLRLETPDALAARLAEIEFFGLPKDDLETYVGRVAAVDPETASQAARRHMPTAEQVAIVVVGPAGEIRPALEERFGPVRVVTRERCDQLVAGEAGAP
jgi:zinc protease